MLRNSSNIFILQSTSRKFLDTLEDILISPRTSPVVRERLMDVLAAAAYASGSSECSFSPQRLADLDPLLSFGWILVLSSALRTFCKL
jgi:hypothetical protein